ncbi:MAG TPA: fumarylacetoacetate hydrolase family protein [Firmicutes bacterium]|nr:fumarylacetoacetate hydrolase family protein [Bacillota bacterium]
MARLVRVDTGAGLFYGVVEEGRIFLAGQRWPWDAPGWWEYVKGGGERPQHLPYIEVEEARLLAPVQPGKVVVVGLNYRDHAREVGAALPEVPALCLKPATAVIGPGEKILLPPVSRRVDYEAELAVVIGRHTRQVPVGQVIDHVLGYTCANDVTARDLQQKDGQWTRSKSFDTFCPLGPWVVSTLEPRALNVTCRVNGEIRQQGNTRDLVFGVAELVSFISEVMTLEAGDVILTGTPPGIGPIQAGDVVEVEVEGVGVLRNPVRSAS